MKMRPLQPIGIWRQTPGVRTTLVSLALVFPAIAAAQSSGGTRDFTVPQWAYPTAPVLPADTIYDHVTPHRIPGSSRTYTLTQAKNAFDVVDWFPASHPRAPRQVQHGGAPAWRACGFCHLPDGQGRPENAVIAGLPADYIVSQVTAFRKGTRLTANPLANTNSMHQIASAAPDSDVAVAARYFSKLRLTRRNRIVETTDAPKTRIASILYVKDGDGTEPIAGRLIEVPEDTERHELHDPTVQYVTYVPPGSLTRGKHIATTGPEGPTTVCASCHGPKLLGVGPVPPIAGRSPSYILRQLINVRSGARHDVTSVPMVRIVEQLSIDDMVALAAYVGSLPPSVRR
ncbi:MAG: hypothetical protein U0132_23400 [Gemmatimonadaceae bacterium]